MVSDRITLPSEADIQNLAEIFEMPSEMMREALSDAFALLGPKGAPPQPIASKKSLRGFEASLAELVSCLSDEAVQERFIAAAAMPAPDGSTSADAVLLGYIRARERFDTAHGGMRDMLEIARAADALRARPGRRSDDALIAPIQALHRVWAEDLGRPVTISGHAADPRGVKPSAFLSFIHRCLHAIGVRVEEQACRTILLNLRDRNWRP